MSISYMKVSLDSSAHETTLGSLGLKRFQGVANGGVVMEGSCVQQLGPKLNHNAVRT